MSNPYELKHYLNAINYTKEDLVKRQVAINRGTPSILMISVARAGSSTIIRQIAKITKTPRVEVASERTPIEHDMALGYLYDFSRGGGVTYVHSRANKKNLHALSESQTTKFILHLRDPRQAFLSNYYRMHAEKSWIYNRVYYNDLPIDYDQKSFSEQIDWQIENVYQRYWLSWIEEWCDIAEDKNNKFNIKIITFEEFKRNPIAYYQSIVDFYGLDSNKVTAIHEGVSDVFRARDAAQCLSLTDYGLQYREFFLFVGSLEPRKNIVRIIEAYLSARQQSGFSWPLILVGGPGWQNSRELEAIEDLTQRGWGRYLGPVTQQALAELYASTRALVFPSIYEGFGLPALEAQRSGTPTITSAGSAMAEFNCAADTLVNPFDVQDIAAAISRAALEPPVTISLAEAPAAALTWNLTAQKTQAVYQQLQSS